MLQRRISTHARTAVPTRQQEGRAFTDLALKQHIVVKPGTPIQPIINASLAGQSIYLLPGEHPVYEPPVVRAGGGGRPFPPPPARGAGRAAWSPRPPPPPPRPPPPPPRGRAPPRGPAPPPPPRNTRG